MFIIRQQGNVFQAFNLPKKPAPPPLPSKREKISGFSVASRRRLIDFLARMDESYKRATFVTLTFAGNPSHAEAKAALKRFLQRVREYFGEASGLWRMDYQTRGAIHFHFIFFNLPFWPQYHLQDTWTECTGEVSSRVDIRLIRKFSVYMKYISKYVAKASVSEANPSLVSASYQQNKPTDPTGRFWGYFQKDLLPLAQMVEIWTGDEDFGKYALFACTGMSHGYCGNSEYTRKCYTPQAADMFQFTVEYAKQWRMTKDLEISALWNEDQWFGSPAVIGGTGVPLAPPDAWTPAPPMLWASPKHVPPHALEMPAGEAS